MILAEIAAFLIDRKFYVAAAWSGVAALFAATGLTHAYQVFGIEGKPGNFVDFLFVFQQPVEGALAFRSLGIAIGYLLFAAIFAATGLYHARQGERGA